MIKWFRASVAAFTRAVSQDIEGHELQCSAALTMGR